jgi:imidazole glycerol phosphate synthase glutamine amidotransferase subunit
VKLVILDYGAGNLRSVQNTLEEIGAQYETVGKLVPADKIILPGVGHFGQMMRALSPQRDAIISAVRAGTPFLGICLGLQALFERSEEAPEEAGFGLFPGAVKRFPLEVRCPQMGWNNLQPAKPSRLVNGEPYVYFANSYYCPVSEATAAVCTYSGITFTAVLEHDNIYGVQFHPEKSGPAGMDIVRRFVEC